jgi:hypothetical protein
MNKSSQESTGTVFLRGRKVTHNNPVPVDTQLEIRMSASRDAIVKELRRIADALESAGRKIN